MDIISPAIANASIGNSPSILKSILDPSINITVFKRSVLHLENELISLIENNVKIRVSGTPGEIRDTILIRLGDLNINASGVINDIMALMGEFGDITQASQFRVTLTTVDSDMCRRFHTDINDLRMLCTYLGKGTLWVSEGGWDRNFLDQQSRDKEFVPESKYIQQAKAGEVLILKGALHPTGEAVLHRSPSIEELGEKRLLLRIDTNERLAI